MKFTRGAVTFAAFAGLAAANATCKSIPGDSRWPSPAAWQSLNKTINGHLIATVPLPSVCHVRPFGDYSVDECAEIKTEWLEAETL